MGQVEEPRAEDDEEAEGVELPKCLTCEEPNDRGPGTTNCHECWQNECMVCGEVFPNPEDLWYVFDHSQYECTDCKGNETACPADDWPCADPRETTDAQGS